MVDEHEEASGSRLSGGSTPANGLTLNNVRMIIRGGLVIMRREAIVTSKYVSHSSVRLEELGRTTN
jgi:hypothetical protein